MEPKQMDTQEFMRVYGFKRSKLMKMIHSKGFPAYYIGGQWYIDIEEYKEWRKKEHESNYKYA